MELDLAIYEINMNKKLKILKYFLGSQICYQVQKQAMMLPTSFNLPMGLEESFS